MRESVLNLLQKIPKSYYLPISLFLIGFLLFGAGLIQFLGSRSRTDIPAVSAQDTEATTSAKDTFGLLQVDVEGAVVRPGVYRLKQDARVQDALVAAGGFSANANRNVISQKINLAAKLSDGMKIYIPDFSQPSGQGGLGPSVDYLGAQVHLLDLNSASAEELDSLPGVGSVTAQKIISARPFTSVNDLLTKKVVTNSVYQKIKDLVTVF